MPIIECLRGPLTAYIERRPQGFLFEAPRPKDPEVPISNVASKAMNRLFRRNGIPRCFHELRNMWIEEARHSPIPKDLGRSSLGIARRPSATATVAKSLSCWRKPTRKSANS
jgi:hypothetical protein